eukprot:gene18045-biopygen7714
MGTTSGMCRVPLDPGRQPHSAAAIRVGGTDPRGSPALCGPTGIPVDCDSLELCWMAPRAGVPERRPPLTALCRSSAPPAKRRRARSSGAAATPFHQSGGPRPWPPMPDARPNTRRSLGKLVRPAESSEAEL